MAIIVHSKHYYLHRIAYIPSDLAWCMTDISRGAVSAAKRAGRECHKSFVFWNWRAGRRLKTTAVKLRKPLKLQRDRRPTGTQKSGLLTLPRELQDEIMRLVYEGESVHLGLTFENRRVVSLPCPQSRKFHHLNHKEPHFTRCRCMTRWNEQLYPENSADEYKWLELPYNSFEPRGYLSRAYLVSRELYESALGALHKYVAFEFASCRVLALFAQHYPRHLDRIRHIALHARPGYEASSPLKLRMTSRPTKVPGAPTDWSTAISLMSSHILDPGTLTLIDHGGGNLGGSSPYFFSEVGCTMVEEALGGQPEDRHGRSLACVLVPSLPYDNQVRFILPNGLVEEQHDDYGFGSTWGNWGSVKHYRVSTPVGWTTVIAKRLTGRGL